MKDTRVKVFIITVLLLTSLTDSTNAQSVGDIRAFGGLGYGTGLEDIGFNIGGEYLINDHIAGDASYSYYFTGSDVRFSVVNIDARYYIPSQSDFQWYGLFGLAFNTQRIRSNTLFGRNPRFSETGLNFGGGFVFPFSSNFGFHGQAKYNTGFDGQLELQAGLSYELN